MSDIGIEARAPKPGTAAGPAAGPAPPRWRGRPGRRRSVTQRQRPLWMLIPGGVLMTVVIIIPLLLGFYISLIDLDQYTLRRWLSAPFIGLQNYVEAVTDRSCCARSGSASRSR